MATIRTTQVEVDGETWTVPSGFGRMYREEAERLLALGAKRDNRSRSDASTLSDIMSLVGWRPTVDAIMKWPLRKRVEAMIYAANVHARASDNPVQRHPELAWLPEPWGGPYRNAGAFSGPEPTEIVE